MKRATLLFLASIVAVLVVVSASEEAQAASNPKPTELKVASFLPESDHQNVTARKVFGEVERRTGGKVRFAYFYAQSLVGAKEAFEGTVKRRCDIYNGIVPAYTPGRSPLTSLIDLAPNIQYGEDASVAFWDFFNKYLKEEWKEMKVLAVHIQAPQHINMGKDPIQKMSDLKGKQIRVYGPGKDIVNAWGGTPVSMPMSEAYLALHRGICDGILAPLNQMMPNKLHEVTKHHTIMGVLGATFVVGMNWDSYNALPKDVRKVLDEIGDWASREYGRSWDRDEIENLEFLKKVGGHTFILLPPDELAKWKAKAISINDAWIAKLEAKGVPAKKIYKRKMQIWNKYLSKEKPWAQWVK